MQKVGEIDRRTAGRKIKDFALRRQNVDMFVFSGFRRRSSLNVTLPSQHLAQPSHTIFFVFSGLAFGAFFVTPMCGHTEFCELVHRTGSDLDLERFSSGAHNHGMQRLITVGFRFCDVIVEFFRENFERFLNQRKRLITFFDRIHDDADRSHVEELFELQVLLAHLLPDGIDVFRTSGNRSLNTSRSQQCLNSAHGFLNRSNTFFTGFFKVIGNRVENFRFGKAQRQIFELPFHLPNT